MKQYPAMCAQNEGLRIASVDNVYRILAGGDQTNQRYTLIEVTLLPGKGAPLHIHTREEEAFFVLKGEVVFYTETERIVASCGAHINFPIGMVRGFRNETNQDAVLLGILAPAGLEQMWLEQGIGTVLMNTSEPPPAPSLAASECPSNASRYGIEILSRELPSPRHGNE